MKKIEIDIFNEKMTVTQAVEIAKEVAEAKEITKMINSLIFKQLDNKTSWQIGFVLGDVKRFCNAIEHELLEMRRKAFLEKIDILTEEK